MTLHKSIFSRLTPPQALVLGYLMYTLVGWLLLCMPICHTEGVSILNNLFIATSAVSTTGLTTIDVGTHYTFLGQLVILTLIQIGGIGYMTFSSFVIFAIMDKLSSFRKKVAMTALSLPKQLPIHEFLPRVVFFTLLCEVIGAIILSLLFASKGVEHPVWNGIFHSISAYCTAGFSLFPDSLMSFKYDFGINMTISLLCIFGAVGFIAWLDIYKKLKKQKERLTFLTKVILSVTFCFIAIGSFVFFFVEGPLSGNTIYERVITSFFQTMTASTTAGYNSLDIGTLTEASIILLTFLMVFGASPAGTGGGLKSTAFVTLVGLVITTISGRNVVSFWKREISNKRVQLATATLGYYLFVLTFSVFLLTIFENKPFLRVLFEAASALGTVGLSMGITSDLTTFGKLMISVLMLMGRVGILTFGIALSVQKKDEVVYKKDNELVF